MSINLHLWKSEEKNIKLETLEKITLNGSHSAKWLEKLKVDFSNGSITEKDIKRIDKHLDNKESRTEVLKLLNNLVSIYKEAIDKKICNKADYTKFLKIIPDHLKNCKIDEIIKNIADPELFNKIIQQKYEKNGDELDLDSLNKILKHMNEIKDKKTTYVWNSDLQEKILNIEPADKFSEIVHLLHHNNLIKKQNLDEIVIKKVKTVNDINDKLLIIHKYPESKKLMPIFIQDFASKEIKDWKKFANECKTKENKLLLFNKFLHENKTIQCDFSSTINFYEKTLELGPENLLNVFPLLLKTFPITKNDYLHKELIKKSLDDEKTKSGIAIMLSIEDPARLVDIFKVCKFNTSEKLHIIIRVIAQNPNFNSLKEDIKFNNLLEDTLDEGFEEELNEATQNCLNVIGKRDKEYFINLTASLMNLGPERLDSPSNVALQGESGRGHVSTYSDDILPSWTKEKKENYLNELLKDSAHVQLAMIRLNTGNQHTKEEMIQYILNNLNKIPLETAFDAIRGLNYSRTTGNGLLLFEMILQIKLDSIKETSHATVENVVRIINERIDHNEELKTIFSSFKGKLIKSNDNYASIKTLFAFAYFVDKIQSMDSPETKELLSNNNIKSLIETIIFLRKPENARFFMLDHFIENIKKDSKALLNSKGGTAQELIKLQLSSFYDLSSLDEKNFPFGGEKPLKEDSQYLPIALASLQDISRNPILSGADKIYLVDFITGQKPIKQNLIAEDIKKNLNYVNSILRLGGAGYLYQENLETLFDEKGETLLAELGARCLSEQLPGRLTSEEGTKLLDKLEKTRDPSFVLDVVSKLHELSHETQTNHLKAFANALEDYINDTFEIERYKKSPHLKLMDEKLKSNPEFKHFSEKWQNIELPKKTTVKSLIEINNKKVNEEIENYEVYLSDDILDLTLMGTEVLSSCMNIKTGVAVEVMNILGNVIDGKTQIVVLKKTNSPAEPMEGRAMIKLLWDEKGQTPVILLLGIKTKRPEDQPQAKDMEKALFEASIQIAQLLKVPIVTGADVSVPSDKHFTLYPHSIASLAPNRAPSEKCDSLYQQGEEVSTYKERDPHQVEQGYYIIERTKQLWAPRE